MNKNKGKRKNNIGNTYTRYVPTYHHEDDVKDLFYKSILMTYMEFGLHGDELTREYIDSLYKHKRIKLSKVIKKYLLKEILNEKIRIE